MNHTIEDALEILAGSTLRSVNIRIDSNEVSLIRSLGRQVGRGTGLTDRQIDLSLKKIEKYRQGLEKNSVDVDHILTNRPLKIPVRYIDRTQTIFLETTQDKKSKISVKFVFSKKFAGVWMDLQKSLIGQIREEKNKKEIPFNEKNLYAVVTALKSLDFETTEEVDEIYQNIENILEDPSENVPYVSFENEKIEIKNASLNCTEYLKSQFPVYRDEDFLVFLERVKNCGIFHKNTEILKKIDEKTTNSLIKNILIETSTRFRLEPTKYGIDTVFDVINELKQWPALIFVDDKKETIPQVKSYIEHLTKYIPQEEINVFFRLENDTQDNKDFNQYVKDQKLNSYIGPDTKVVFITKNRIPKPLLNADWKPHTAVVATTYEYGKTSAYISDFLTVYYYNNNLRSNYTRKGNSVIVQL